MQYEIIAYDEFTNRNAGGCYLLYWLETMKYYFGRAKDYGRRGHQWCVDIYIKTKGEERDHYLNRYWAKHGPPDIAVVIPLDESMQEQFEQTWLDIFRSGPLYNKTVCLNTSKSATMPTPTHEQSVEAGRRCHEMGLGVHALTHKQHSENGKKSRDLGAGIHGRTPEQMSEQGKRSGKACHKMGAGVHGLTPEQHRENYKKGPGKFTHEQLSENGKRGWASGLGKCTTEQRREYGQMRRSKTPAEVHDIRHLLALGDMSHSEIAKCFGVCRKVISNINTGKSYADV